MFDAAAEIEAKRTQAKFLWPFIERYIHEVEHESEDGVLVESIDVWPDLIATSGLIHRAAFLVDTSASSQADRIIASRGSDPHDWMHQNEYSDGRIKALKLFLK